MLMAALAMPAHAAGAPPGCLDWTEARPIIRSQGLISSSDVEKRLIGAYGGQVLAVHLCERNQAFVYDVVMLDGQGRVRKIVVDARTGQTQTVSFGNGPAQAGAAR